MTKFLLHGGNTGLKNADNKRINMKIYSWNVNGIRACNQKGLTSWIKKTSPDVLCMQETKARLNDFPDEILKLNKYNLYHSDAQKKGYSGVAILCKEKPKKVITKTGKKEFDNEGRFLLLEFDKYIVFNTYFPHSQRELKRMDFKMKFNKTYLSFISKIKTRKPIILTGDFNVAHQEIDLKNPKTNTKNAGFTVDERKFVDKMIAKGWVDVFRTMFPEKIQYTWWSYMFNARKRNVGWRIDCFFVKQKDYKKINNTQIHDKVLGSDHCPISLDMKI